MSEVLAHGMSKLGEYVDYIYQIDDTDDEIIKKEIEGIVSYISETMLAYDQRKSIDGCKGVWHICRIDKSILFVLVSQNYPIRLSYQMLTVK